MTLIAPSVLARARSLFPYLSSGAIYLNHAATSPIASPVAAALTAHLNGRMNGPIDTVESDLPMIRDWRTTVARLINAGSPERIAFAMNTSDGLNIVAAGMPWRSGDHVIVNSAEFPANLHPFLHLRRHGVSVEVLPCDDGTVTPDRIERSIRPSTRMIALSAVQFLSGYRADLTAIGTLCRDRGIVFVVDGIQAVGAVPVDVQAMNIDALAAGAQKWQMSLQGTGFLYVTQDLQRRIVQQHVGWLSVATPWNFHDLEQGLDPTARRYEGGTPNVAGLHAMHAALTMLLDHGIEAIEQHLVAITDVLMEALSVMEGVHILTPRDPARRAGIVTVRPPAGLRAEALVAGLRRRNITVAVREGLIRFSPHFYNTPDEMHTAAAALHEVIREARRSPAPDGGGNR